jgi:hypothetical protein
VSAAGLAAGGAAHYLRRVPLPRPARPSVVWEDLRAFMRDRPRHQWVAAMLAVMIPMGILLGFYVQTYMQAQPRPQVIYVNNWPSDRSDEEIRAKQQADLARERAVQAERQRQFQRLEKQAKRFGI